MDASSILAISTIIIFKDKPIRRTFHRRPVQKKEPEHKINERIRALEVRLIGEAGEQFGVIPTQEALAMAQEQSLDLVEVSPKSVPPVCRIMDYGKFQYQQSKQERIHKVKQKKSEIKGIRIGARTDEHDLNFKKDQAEKFLTKGNKVKVEIILRGREKAYQDLARQNLQNFIKNITAPYKIEQEIKRFPGGFNVIITPEIIAK